MRVREGVSSRRPRREAYVRDHESGSDGTPVFTNSPGASVSREREPPP